MPGLIASRNTVQTVQTATARPISQTDSRTEAAAALHPSTSFASECEPTQRLRNTLARVFEKLVRPRQEVLGSIKYSKVSLRLVKFVALEFSVGMYSERI